MCTARLFDFAFGDFQGEALGLNLGTQFIRLGNPIIDIVRFRLQRGKIGLSDSSAIGGRPVMRRRPCRLISTSFSAAISWRLPDPDAPGFRARR